MNFTNSLCLFNLDQACIVDGCPARGMRISGQDISAPSPVYLSFVRVIPRPLRQIDHTGHYSLSYSRGKNYLTPIVKHPHLITIAYTPLRSIDCID